MLQQPDSLLTAFADVITAQRHGAMRLSVLTDGFLVSGVLIPDHEYFSALGERLEGAFEIRPDDGDEREPRFQWLQEAVMEEHAARAEDHADAPPRRFLHMRDVAIRGAGESVVHFPYWRVRLDRVSGYDVATEGDLPEERSSRHGEPPP